MTLFIPVLIGIMKKKIIKILNLFPEVIWDRYSGGLKDMAIFGWIDRKDGRKDFLVMDIVNGKPQFFRTSSAKLSKSFSERLGWTHSDCKRVEDLFRGNVKCLIN